MMAEFDPRYLRFFELFNQADYYEAHEVLEDLWHTVRPDGAEANYYKGLIQLAGAFTHLKLHRLYPDHRIHGRRLFPAARLFRRARANLTTYGDFHQGIQLEAVCDRLIDEWLQRLERDHCQVNPLDLKNLPKLTLPN